MRDSSHAGSGSQTKVSWWRRYWRFGGSFVGGDGSAKAEERQRERERQGGGGAAVRETRGVVAVDPARSSGPHLFGKTVAVHKARDLQLATKLATPNPRVRSRFLRS